MDTPQPTPEETTPAETAEEIVVRELKEESEAASGAAAPDEAQDEAESPEWTEASETTLEDDPEPDPEPEAEADEPEPDAEPEIKAEDAIDAIDALAKFGISTDTLDALSPDEAIKLAAAIPGEPEAAVAEPKTADKSRPVGVVDTLNDVFDETEADSIRAAVQEQTKRVVEALIPQLAELRAGMMTMATNAGPLLRDQERPKLLSAYPELEDDALWDRVQARAQTLTSDPKFTKSPGEALGHAAYIETYANRKAVSGSRNARLDRLRGASQAVTTRPRTKSAKKLTPDEILTRNARIAAGVDTNSRVARENAQLAMRDHGSL